MAVYQEKDKSRWTKDGRKWYFKCYYKDLQGNRVCKKSKMFAKQSEAKDEERKFLSEINVEVPMPTISFKELINNVIKKKIKKL